MFRPLRLLQSKKVWSPRNNEEIYKGQMALMRVPFLKLDSRMKVPPESSVLSLNPSNQTAK
jgi:hypothetical protein